MKYNTYTSDRVSALGYGCMRFPTTTDGDGRQIIDKEQALKLLDTAYKGGVNYFDTAYFYHDKQSEKFVGEALSAYPRESYYIATKMPCSFITRESQIDEIFNEQLSNLRTDYFDYYLMHALSKETFDRPLSRKAYDYLLRKKQEGKIRHLGFSFHDTPEAFLYIIDAKQWDFCQIQYNYIDRYVQRAGELLDAAVARGVPLVIMEPVRGGVLARLPIDAARELRTLGEGRSNASYALRYAADNHGVMTVLSGMSDMEQVTDNLRTFDTLEPLTNEELAALDRVREIYLSLGAVECTGCRYCLDKCPQKVRIPDIFGAYNEYVKDNDSDAYEKRKQSIVAADGFIDKCVNCGACRTVCPQYIDIPATLRRVNINMQSRR